MPSAPPAPAHTPGANESESILPPGVNPDPPPAPQPIPPQPTPPQVAPCSTLRVWINAFIPKSVPGYTFTVPGVPHASKTAIPCPAIALPVTWHCLHLAYLSDPRT